MERQSAGLGPFALGNTPKRPGNVKMRDYKEEEFTKRKPVMDLSQNLFSRQKIQPKSSCPYKQVLVADRNSPKRSGCGKAAGFLNIEWSDRFPLNLPGRTVCRPDGSDGCPAGYHAADL